MGRRLEEMVTVDNSQHPHVATVLLLDTSESMDGAKVDELNKALRFFKDEVEDDDLASKRVDLAVVTFDDSVEVLHDFSGIGNFDPPTLTAGGYTSMGDAILKAAEMIETRKAEYKQNGVDFYRPWIFMITDGEPTDMAPGDAKWNQVVNVVREGEKNKKFMFFTVAADPANTSNLKDIAPVNRPPIKLKGTKYRELFAWLSRSQAGISNSTPGDQVTLESPMAAGWGTIES